MSSSVIFGFLTEQQVMEILADETVQEMKAKFESGERNECVCSDSMHFVLPKTRFPEIFSRIEGIVELGESVPMKWIKGDSEPHVDTNDKAEKPDFTFMIQAHSVGKMVLGDKRVDIEKGMAVQFPKDYLHGTENCGSAIRLIVGPMNQHGQAVASYAWSTSVKQPMSNDQKNVLRVAREYARTSLQSQTRVVG
jgi:hypothetical protein